MKKAVVSLVGAIALTTIGMAAVFTNSMAASNQSFSNNTAKGIFISGNLGYSKVGDSEPGLSNTGFAWNGNLGYQFNKYIALETGYTQFPNLKFTFNSSGGNISETTKIYGIDLLVKGILPINNKFSLFAMAGAMYFHTASTAITTGVYYLNRSDYNGTTSTYRPEVGLGAAYNLTKNVALSLQGITALDGSNSTYTGYTGLSYKFNM